MTNKITTEPGKPVQAADNQYSSEELFRGQQEIVIEHEDYQYRLRITRQNKLILTK